MFLRILDGLRHQIRLRQTKFRDSEVCRLPRTNIFEKVLLGMWNSGPAEFLDGFGRIVERFRLGHVGKDKSGVDDGAGSEQSYIYAGKEQMSKAD